MFAFGELVHVIQKYILYVHALLMYNIKATINAQSGQIARPLSSTQLLSDFVTGTQSATLSPECGSFQFGSIHPPQMSKVAMEIEPEMMFRVANEGLRFVYTDATGNIMIGTNTGCLLILKLEN